MATTGERIKQLRKEHDNLHQADLAELLGTTEVTISRYENGRDPGIDNIKKLAQYFGVTVDYLTGFSDSKFLSATTQTDPQINDILDKISNVLYPRMKKASILGEEISNKSTEDRDYDNYVSEIIRGYVLSMIDVIGDNIDFCIDNSSQWVHIGNDGKVSIDNDTACKLLDKKYFYLIQLEGKQDI